MTGTDGHFCAGADLTGVEDTEFVRTLGRVLRGLHEAAVPTIAAIEGAALGAGTQLAVACDLRVATYDAQFGIPAAKLGLMVDQWTIDRLTRVAGEGPARAMLLAAEVYRGEAALGFGMVQRLGAPSDAIEWAEQIAAFAPLTIAGHKLGLNGAEDDVYAERLPGRLVERRPAGGHGCVSRATRTRVSRLRDSSLSGRSSGPTRRASRRPRRRRSSRVGAYPTPTRWRTGGSSRPPARTPRRAYRRTPRRHSCTKTAAKSCIAVSPG